MINQLKAEFKKIFTIRSTYIILALMLGLLFFFGFYVGGWHLDKIDLLNPLQLYRTAQQSINFLSIFPALIALLLITHEYRHNLISYSLTLSNSRSKVLASKVIVVTVLSLFTSAVVLSLSPLFAKWGVHSNHHQLIHQSFYFWSIAWKGLIYGWGYAMVGLLLGVLIRNQIGAIVVLFIVPDTVEGLLSILLKNNTDYLPFSALHTMLGAGLNSQGSSISPIHALYVFLSYLIGGWIIAWFLFLRRDA
jgi:ABC-2 type transport system permease protein